MSFSFNGISTAVTISGAVTTSPAVPTPSSSQSVINVGATGTGASQDVYTVPAGSIFYLYGITGEAFNGYGYIYNNAGTTMAKIGNFNANVAAFVSPVPIASYTAGQVVKCNWSNASPYNIWGILVTL